MNIAVDLTPVPKSKAGVGRYIVNLVEWLQKIDNKNNYYLIVQDDDKDSFPVKNTNFRQVPVKSKYLRNVLLRLVWEQIILPFKLKKLNADILHSPHYTIPYFSLVKSVVTFHDMTYFIIPQMHTLIKRFMFRAYIRLTAKRAAGILSVSDSTAQDMVRLLGMDRSKIAVTPLGVDERFFETINPDHSILESYGIDKEYFLYVGTIEPRKNLVRLIKAYSCLSSEAKDKYRLVICGQKGWMYNEVLELIQTDGLEDHIRFTGFVKDEDLPAIYRGAKLFLYVSLYEGFGIPLIEAMARGVPCITSDLSSMKEIAGEACLKINPYEENEIKNAIIELLKNEELYDSLKEKGMAQAKKFRWIDCAKKTLEAYEKTCGGMKE